MPVSRWEYYKKAKSVEGKKQSSALKGDRDDEISAISAAT
jgi:hypothetical protein